MRVKMIISFILMCALTGCTYNGPEYFGEDLSADEKFLYKDAYQTDEDYILENFDNKPVSTNSVAEVKSYDFIETTLAIATSSDVDIKVTATDPGSSNSKAQQVKDAFDINKKNGVGHQGKCIGTFEVTAYCSCCICCHPYDPGCTGRPSKTASGVAPMQGYTIATDWSVIKKGTKVIINGHVFEAQDKGGAISGNKIDIYYSDHKEALKWGRRTVKVYAYKE